MQEINQILFVLFALILLGIYISTLADKENKADIYTSHYWRWSLLFRAIGYITWGLVPLIGNAFLTLANMMVMSSVLLLAMLFRSWRVPISKNLEIACVAITVIITVCFEVLRQLDDSFKARLTLVGSFIIVAGVWALFELILNHRKDKSGALKVVIVIVLIQVALTTALVAVTNLRSQDGVSQVTQHQSLLVVWSAMSAHLLTYIAVSSYLYQRLLISKRRALQALQEKKQELVVTTKEKEEVAALLAEREDLIQSLIHANKTALTGALSASIAHEINQPLGAINLNIEFLKFKLQGDDPETLMIKDVIQSIHHDTERASSIILGMQKIFKQDDIQAVETNLNQLVESLIGVFHPKAKSNHVAMEIDLQATARVNLNQDAFQQVILNLVNNAIDAVSQSGSVEKKIWIQTRDSADSVELIVSDNGAGVPEEQKRNLFNLMKTTKETGLGLGLWLSRYIVERHGGTIRCDNRPEGGACFTVSLPLIDSD
jgi:C4-dicarboxylate-specific signal transduction histidine kinase